MAQTFTCPQGHQWEDTFGDFSLAPGAPMVCPVCGAVTERESTSTQSMARPAPRDFPRDEVPTQATAVPNNFKVELAGPLPEIVGYEILGELGRGGMGVV
ncbi:MAG TPA: hypothetical protein VJY33_14850, partial [Isosphaeraceae bacterium]|nr:hypothetical protein [Isosphaeraceae bacterium]